MRVIAKRILLAAGAVSLLACVVLSVSVMQSYERAVVNDDFAGFSLGIHFLAYALVPLTLSLFAAACLLDPPDWLPKRVAIGTPPAEAPRSVVRTVLMVLCPVGAAAIVLGVVIFVGANVVGAARHYGYSARGLVMILLQNLVLSAPLLVLGALLAWAGRGLQTR